MHGVEELGIGVMVRFAVPVEESFRRLKSFGLRHCQFAGLPDAYLYGAEGRSNTQELVRKMERYDVASCSVFCSFPDQRSFRIVADNRKNGTPREHISAAMPTRISCARGAFPSGSHWHH